MTRTFLPGATLGMIGGGQLGRMFAVAARRMGYRVKVFTDELDSPGAQLADESVLVDFTRPDDLDGAMDDVDVVTYETENLPLAFVARAAEHAVLRPGLDLLRLSQHRLIEKTELSQLGLPVAEFCAIRTAPDLAAALEQFQYQAVLKTTEGGYDGKGQWMVRGPQDTNATQAAASILASPTTTLAQDESLAPLVLERIVDFELEFSVIGARSVDGDFKTYGPILNHHHDHILDVSVCPADLGDKVSEESHRIVRRIAAEMNVVGLFCVEFFLTRDGNVVINEVAPRTHNSGHLTIESHVTCQFAQQVRAISGLALGSSESMRPAAMANLLGDLWLEQAPDWQTALSLPGVSLHLYGKRAARAKRKMGHLTAIGNTTDQAIEAARQGRKSLARG